MAGAAQAEPLAGLADLLERERHRWFLWIPILVGVGIGAYFALPFEPSLALAGGLLLAAIAVAWLVRDGTIGYAATRAILAVVIGFAVATIRTDWVAAPIIERSIQRADIRGYVELVEPLAARGQRLTIRVSAIAGIEDSRLPRRIRVRIMNPQPGIGPGDAITVRARLSPPGEPVLPGGYDFARRAWYLGIGGVGFSFDPPKLDPTAAPPPMTLRMAATIERVRLAIGAAVTAALPGQTGAIANALLTGDRGGITPEVEKAYRDSGLTHVLSISGLHMTVMAGTLFVAVRTLLAAIPGLAIRFPIKIWAAAVATLGAFGYLLISGGAFATLRSYVMITIIFLAMIAERPALSMRNVALAALALLIVWPESLLDPGFQMSFAAVTALLAAFEGWQRKEERLGRATAGPSGPFARAAIFVGGIMGSTLIAGFAVAPLAAYHFHTSQQYSIIGNVLALPICDLLVMPALLATLVLIPVGLEAYPLMVAGWGIDAMTAIARYVGGLPGAVAAIPSISLYGLLAMAGGGLWLMLWTGRWRVAGLVPIAAGIILAPIEARPDILVSRDGSIVVARVDGRYLSVAPPNATKPSKRGTSGGAQRDVARRPVFELTRWLEADGDGRSVVEAIAGRGFNCDTVGCAAVIRGKRIAILRHKSGAADDCRTADILITDGERPRGCDRPAVIIDAKALRSGGVHAVAVGSAGHITVETVAASRGDRPWAKPLSRRLAGLGLAAKANGATVAEPSRANTEHERDRPEPGENSDPHGID
ncbi:MAG: ComEC family competence protein [Hyphomicrobiaceae bacterium]|nr:ComEC family competence protein [Hyphomicrobiaceae bacterium]